MGRLDEFYAARPEHRPRPPISELAAGRSQYIRQRGGRPSPFTQADYQNVAVQEPIGRRIAQTYDRMPDYSEHPLVQKSFKAMGEETSRQFEFLTGSRRKGGLGLDVSVEEEDPYANPEEMMTDVRENSRLKVLSDRITGGHPIFTPTQNEEFRAVHDAFGHAATGRGFDRHGEEAAWLSHSQMYSPLARGAMTTETRGQNSAFIFTGGGLQFPKQKVGILPAQFTDPSITPIGRRSQRRHKALSDMQFRS